MNKQLSFFPDLVLRNYTNGNANKVFTEDQAIHKWYRFVLSFPPHLVRQYFDQFGLKPGDAILDPFCGTGTTLVEAKLNGLHGIGIEANDMAYFASKVKTDWDVDTDQLLADAHFIASEAKNRMENRTTETLRTFSEEQWSIILKDSISPLPLHKSLSLLEVIHERNSKYLSHLLLAFTTSTVKKASNLHFGPEVGVSRKKKNDVDVVQEWVNMVHTIVADLQSLSKKLYPLSNIIKGDARLLDAPIKKESIDAVFTSPPYPNEKDYTRTTRLESVLLGFIKSKEELKKIKRTLLRSNTRNVYKGDDDDLYIKDNPEILRIANAIEQRRIELGKTSGFERLYHKVAKLYFGGMARHLENIKPYLKKNALLGYVVGDQASYLQVHISTGKIIADIAVQLGYELIAIDLFRTRFSTATKQDMREEVVILKWRG